MSEPKRIPPRLAHRVAAILLAVVLVGVAARISVPIPGSPVPQSLQTLAVLLVGFFLGGRDGTLAIAAYLLVGAAGAPVFADGAAGWTHLVGPTAGYLIGFAVAGGGVGWLAARGHLNRFAPAFGAMVLGHAAILLLGWLRLGGTLGYASAFEQGVAPFVGGGAVKSAVGAAMAVGAGRLGWSYLLLSLLAPPQAITAQEAPLITFDHYHTLAEIETYLGEVAARYPELVTLHEIGRSRVGRPIWAVDVNNPATGPAAEKPGFYVDGNIHGGEVLGGEGALAFLERLTSRYGTEQEITELVDSRAFYVVPIVNPDGRAISVDTPENHRWNIRPIDEDGDGLMDEDPPEDLDGDGRMLQMRLLDPEGSWSIHPTDPRRMVRGTRRRGRDTAWSERASTTTETVVSTRTASEASTSTVTSRPTGARPNSRRAPPALRTRDPRARRLHHRAAEHRGHPHVPHQRRPHSPFPDPGGSGLRVSKGGH